MSPDTPCPSKEVLRRSLNPDASMDEAERQRIEAHVDGCERGCKAAIEALLRDNTLAAEPDATSPLGGPKVAAVDRPIPNVPGYEILAELGRGGMGVVYKARQLSLNRLVALKMILAGSYASADGLARFRREAEAVASLQHPNIVQIHEVGECVGAPYITLEYVEGGTLAQQLGGAPQPAQQAAATAETLAWAVESAHRRGVAHRDLKPANVLVAADGVLKITDFGLAKRMEDDAGHTRSGEVVGTPSYMAPEQAQGRRKKCGSACDVYALGAILYEMLTGRPPFRAPTAMETLLQVLSDDPVPPRRLQPKTPRDLETICLKCLQKDPARRYTSAGALAEDLRRFQAHRPIQARPTAWPERGLKWVKRRPVVAALTAAVTLVVLAATATSWALAGWAFYELNAAQQADRRRVQAQVEQLGSAGPEAVKPILDALARDRDAVRPRLRELWADASDDPQRRIRRMRAGLALYGEDPSLRDELAHWMLEAPDPREVLLVRDVLAPHGADLAEWLWSKAEDATGNAEVRFRALAALAAFAPTDPRWDQAAPAAVEQLLKADPLQLGVWQEALQPVRERLNDPLVKVFRDPNAAPSDRRTAAAVLAEYDGDHPAALANLACDADAEQFALLRPPLDKKRQEASAALTAELTRPAPAKEAETDRIVRARRQGNAAAALAALGQPDAVWSVLKHSRTPDARTVLIHGLATHGADVQALIDHLETEEGPSIRAALILALGEYPEKQLPPRIRAALTPKLLAAYRDDPDPGVHGAIDWLLRWGKEGPVDRPIDWGGRAELEKIDAELAGKPGPAGQRWFVAAHGQTFTAVPGPVTFPIGSPKDEPGHGDSETLHRMTIDRSFAVAVQPVTVAQWLKFEKAMQDAHRTIKNYRREEFAPESDCPIISVSWYEAAMYCRWLSEQENVPEKDMVYPCIPEILKHADGRTPLTLDKGYLSRTGYRLPTGAECEYACRAGSATAWCCGGARELLPRYAWFDQNSRNRSWPVGRKKPNELGLFDVHGDAWIWCQDSFRDYAAADAVDAEDDRDIKDDITRVLRGGSFKYQPALLRSAFREFDRPSYPGESTGFRLARTLPPDHFAVSPPK
ncbi:MAG TPA: SUMF1/EgtB/PvdO family nonheme iron enzyme [Gemmataceae bacterium]|nr:SUMF1/EgtB/PvdO family nonheme iron enzyme [Gemmataceae bacterium]